MMYDLAGQQLLGGLNPYSAYAKANQQANLANEVALAELAIRQQQVAQSGQQSTPAALQLANEYQAALQSGNIDRANQIAAFAKIYDKGVQVTPQGQFGVAGGYAPALSEIEKAQKAGSVQGQLQTQAQFDLPGALSSTYQAKKTLADLRAAPGLPAIFGIPGQFPNIPAGDAAAAQALYDKLMGGAFLEGYQFLKGGGQITEYEGKQAANAIIAANRAQSVEDFLKAAADYEDALNRGVQKLQAQSSGEVFQPEYQQNLMNQYGDGMGEIVLNPAPMFEKTSLAEQSKANFKGKQPKQQKIVRFEDLP